MAKESNRAIDGLEFGCDITGWLPKTPGRGLDLERVRLLAWSHIGGDREAVRVTWEDAPARVSVSLPPSTPAWIAARIESAIIGELPAFATVGVFVCKPVSVSFTVTAIEGGHGQAAHAYADRIAEACARDLREIAGEPRMVTQKEVDALAASMAPKPDPRTRREAQRREIDAVLREDARRSPAFAVARKCAVMGAFEDTPHTPKLHTDTAAELCSMLREYESERGGMRAPKAGASAAIEEWGARFGIRGIARDLVASYEIARGLT